MPQPNLSTPEGRSLLSAAIARQQQRSNELDCTHSMKCHVCGNRIRIVLDGEEWCSRCETYQRPVPHGWSCWEAVSAIPKVNT